MKKIILIFFTISFCLHGYTQIITIEDKSSLQAVVNANITNLSYSKATKTDQRGKADLSIFEDNEVIIISHIAYQTLKSTKKEIIAKSDIVLLSDNIIKMDEVVISANRNEEISKFVPQKIEIISAGQISFGNAQTSADLLRKSGDVFVQQSQQGGGSPVLRGFEASKVLIVLDGVRLNNAIYRSGHLQSVITIDPFMLENVELMFGPGSVMYGSDALGGVMHFITAKPALSENDKIFIKTSAFARFSTANYEFAQGVKFNIGFKKWAFFTSVSHKDIGDLKMGKTGNPFYPDWGLRKFYVERVNDTDRIIKNMDSFVQVGTAYSQYDVMQKIFYKPNENASFLVNLQYSNSSNIPRYDRLTQLSGGLPKYAEWYYGPQTRLLTSFKAEFSKKNILFDKLSVTLAYQNISEDRISRRFNKKNRSHQEETVDVLSFNADFTRSALKNSKLNYGIETYLNKVGSVAYDENITNGEVSYNIATRYPDKFNRMNIISMYILHDWKINDFLSSTQGIRYSWNDLHSIYSDTMLSITGFPFEPDFRQKNSAFTGSVGITFFPAYNWKIAIVASSGYHVPNIDDLSKVNDSKSTDKLIIVPNPDLNPEYTYNLDLTLAKTIDKTTTIEVTGFYTILNDAIVLRPFKLNGNDSLLFNGEMCAVQANTNLGNAYIYGCQASLLSQITSSFSVKSNLSYTYGRVKEKMDEVPLDHIPPLFGSTDFRLDIKKFRADFIVNYSGWKRLNDYSISGEDNFEYATAEGNPAWYTLNLMSAYQINNYINLQIGVENILDIHYRMFASGVSAPGRNFVFSVKGTL